MKPSDTLQPDQAAPHAVDRHVGVRIRLRRQELAMSQETLASHLGLTFQQVQKYERATNRVSASKLWEIARALQTNISYFYEGLRLEEETPSPAITAAQQFLLTTEGLELASSFPKLPKSALRRKVLDLVRALTDDDN